MASGPIISCQIDGGNSGNSVRLYFGGSKIIADNDCSHEIKRRMLLGRKAMTNLNSILKSIDMENAVASHSSIFDWRIPWTEKPGGLQSMGSQRVRHD